MEPEKKAENGDDNLPKPSKSMESLVALFHSQRYSKLKKGLREDDLGLEELLCCNEKQLEQELDRHEIIGVFQNQFINAVKATPEWQEQQLRSQRSGM